MLRVTGCLAQRAEDADQALGGDAIQGRDEAVGVDAHVDEAPQDVENVVGVHGGEHQVPGQGRLDGDLGGLRVADLADHDLVRVVAQDGTQPAGEGQAFFLVDRDLHDAFHLVLDRVLDGDDLVGRVLDLVQGGVQGGGLAAAGGAGDQEHAVGLADIVVDLFQDIGGESPAASASARRCSR